MSSGIEIATAKHAVTDCARFMRIAALLLYHGRIKMRLNVFIVRRAASL